MICENINNNICELHFATAAIKNRREYEKKSTKFILAVRVAAPKYSNQWPCRENAFTKSNSVQTYVIEQFKNIDSEYRSRKKHYLLEMLQIIEL